MKHLMNVDFFTDMPGTTFHFQALTKIWFGIAANIPSEIQNDLSLTRDYILDQENAVGLEMNFTGSVSIARGPIEIDAESGERRISMFMESMEEYGYSPELNTTMRLSGRTDKPSFGITKQHVRDIDAGSEARLLLNLQLEGVHGDFATVMKKEPCTTKKVTAPVSSFPFTGGQTVFRHEDSKALAVGPEDAPIAYLAYGIMVPQFPLGQSPMTEMSLLSAQNVEELMRNISDEERSFLEFEE